MEPLWIQALLSIGAGVGLAAAAGFRVFLPLLVLGIAGRLEWFPLADGFEWLASSSGLATLGAATIAEVAAYYVPWVDNALDLVAGPLAVAAGVFATAAVTEDLPPALRWTAAVVAGGGAAAIVQSLTSLARLKSTAVTGGAANPLLATLELLGALATSIIAVALPLLSLVAVVALVLVVRRVRRGLFRRAAPRTS